MKRIITILLLIMTFAPAVAQKARVVKQAPAVRMTKVVPAKSTRPSNDIVVSNENSKNSAYKNLIAQKSMLEQQINGLDAERGRSSKGKAKFIARQMDDLSKQLDVVNRLLATFPIQRDYNEVEFDKNDKAFRGQLDSVATIRIAATDPFAGRISNDPELERMYRDYLAQNRNTPFVSVGRDGSINYPSDNRQPIQYSGDKVFRVMVAISRNAIAPADFDGMSDVVEQRMPRGGYVYYQGSYSSKSDADRACLTILAGRKFRDAFVVAMVGNKRVPL